MNNISMSLVALHQQVSGQYTFIRSKFPVFQPPFPPTLGMTNNVTLRRNNARFADGFSERSVDGINPQNDEVTLDFRDLSQQEADEIDEFLTRLRGAHSMLYKLPGEEVFWTWRCEKWSDASPSGNGLHMTIELIRTYDIKWWY